MTVIHTVVAHPLIDTLERARHIDEHMATLKIAPEGDAWMPLQSLISTTSEPLREMMGRVGTHFKTENRRVPASLFFGDYAFALMALASACYLLDRRVPRLSLDSVWVLFGTNGDVEGIALTDYHFAALSDDPAANHEECLVLPSEDALQVYLLEQTSECLQPLIQAVRANSTLGVPAMWALAADYASSAATFVGRGLKQEARSVEFARQLSAHKSPLRRKRDFIHIEESDLCFDMVDRISCCLYYQVEGGHYCSTCPHRPEEERVERIRTWLAERAAKQAESN